MKKNSGHHKAAPMTTTTDQGALFMRKMATAKQQDMALVQRIALGDKSAMHALYELHAGPLNSFVRNWLADPTQAADLVHETMLAVWKNADRFEGRSSLKSWIFSIARNKSIDNNRRNSRMTYTDDMPEIEDDQLSADDLISASESASDLRKAMAQLSENHRRVLHLAFYEDLKYEEIAKIEDCPVGTVKTRIMHAKRNLLLLVKKTGSKI